MKRNSIFISREEHEEFKKRMEDWNIRQDERLKSHSETIEALRNLTTSIERLAINMEGMLKVQASQGERLQNLELRDGVAFRKAVSYFATAIVGILVGYIFKQIGLY